MGFFVALWDWVREHETWAAWLGFTSLTTFTLTLAALPLVVAYLPADYFTRQRPLWPTSAWGWAVHVVKNLLGLLFLLMGVAMLVLPGQGLLTILIGVMLVEFPGKRRLELWLIRRPALRRSIDWIRFKACRPALDYGHRAARKA
jgi:hypothetical protein